MCDHEPGRAADADVRGAVARGQPSPELDGSGELAQLVEVLDCDAQDLGRVLVLGESVDESNRARHRLAAQRLAFGLGCAFFCFPVGDDCRVARRRRPIVSRVLVGDVLVLARSLAEDLVLEQEIRQAVVDRGRLGRGREGGEEAAIPGGTLLERGAPVFRGLRILIERVIVIREIFEVLLEIADDFGGCGGVEVAPVLGVERIPGGEALLGIEHELREIARLVDLDHAHAEMRRRGVDRVEVHEGVVGVGGVLVAELLEVELGEVAVDPVLVDPRSTRGEEGRDLLRAAEV